MPDDLALEDFLRMHPDLGKLFGIWRDSREVGDGSHPSVAVDEFKNCVLLMEVLAKETRIWLFSRLAASGELPGEFLTPQAAGAFGTDLNFLQQLQHHRFFSGLAGSKLDAKDDFVPLQSVIKLFKNYGDDYDNESFKRELERLPRESHETWLILLGLFVMWRNVDGHQASQVDFTGIPIVITERIRRLAPFLAQAMTRRIPWMLRQAANAFGCYRLRSREDVSVDNHYALHELCEKQGFNLDSARSWYFLCDENRKPVELFARLETDDQISAVVRKLADCTESALFDSAEKGVLLPLIGPAFGLPYQPNNPGARDVIQRAREVVGDPNFASPNDSLKDFLARVISARLNLEIPNLASASRQQCTINARLAGDLAVLALQASMSFGRSLSISGSPLTGGSEALQPADIKALEDRIADARATILTLTKDVPPDHRIDLGADAIEELLKWLRDEVVDGRLSLTSVGRLADLVWHALRWDAPLYPDAEALDVQLWLGTRRDPNTRRAIYDRTPAASGAALLIDPLKLIDYFEGWSRRLDETISDALKARHWGWRDPHEILAEVMASCLETRRGTPLASERQADKENVFIVDATFDQRISMALKVMNTPAAVIYPVDLEDIHKCKFPGWAIRRFPPPAIPDPEDGLEEHSILWHGIGRSISYQDVPRVLVIKPFGAPGELTGQLAKAAKVAIEKISRAPLPIDTEHYIAVKRRYLFDDVSILNDLVRRQDSMPPGFRDALHQSYSMPFELYFLGYSLEEYGRRARMLADIRPTEWDGIESRGNLLYFSEPPPGGLVSPYLKGAGIDHYDTPLRTEMKNLELRLGRSERGGRRRV